MRHSSTAQTTKWAGRLIVLYGAAHTLGALTAEGAASHADAWFGGDLWGTDLDDTTPAMSASWLTLGLWTVVDAGLSGPGGQGLILLAAVVLLLVGDRRARQHDTAALQGASSDAH